MIQSVEPEEYTARELVIIGHGGGAMIGLLEGKAEASITLLDPMLLVSDQRGRLEMHDCMFSTKRLTVHNGYVLFRLADLEEKARDPLQKAYVGAMTQKRTGIELVTNRLR